MGRGNYTMSLGIMKMMLLMGIIGHAINMYCDRILSIFPNGTLNFGNIKDIGEGDMAARLMEGASEKIPMRSAVLGAFALVLEFLGYFSLASYTYGYSHIYGSIMFVMTALFCIVGAAYHVKTALAEYLFIKWGRDEKAKGIMLVLMNAAPILRICAVGLLAYIIVLIIAIITGTIGFPIWALLFTIVPIFILVLPFKIIGSLHIAAMVSMLAWMLLL